MDGMSDEDPYRKALGVLGWGGRILGLQQPMEPRLYRGPEDEAHPELLTRLPECNRPEGSVLNLEVCVAAFQASKGAKIAHPDELGLKAGYGTCGGIPGRKAGTGSGFLDTLPMRNRKFCMALEVADQQT